MSDKPRWVPKPDDINLDGVYRLVCEGTDGNEYRYIRLSPVGGIRATCDMGDPMEYEHMTEKDWGFVRNALIIELDH